MLLLIVVLPLLPPLVALPKEEVPIASARAIEDEVFAFSAGKADGDTSADSGTDGGGIGGGGGGSVSIGVSSGESGEGGVTILRTGFFFASNPNPNTRPTSDPE